LNVSERAVTAEAAWNQAVVDSLDPALERSHITKSKASLEISQFGRMAGTIVEVQRHAAPRVERRHHRDIVTIHRCMENRNV
jgi:hypothetical protein